MQQFTFDIFMKICACESLSEALILASINPQYDKILFIDLPVLTWKLQAQNMLCTKLCWVSKQKQKNDLCTQHVLSL